MGVVTALEKSSNEENARHDFVPTGRLKDNKDMMAFQTLNYEKEEGKNELKKYSCLQNNIGDNVFCNILENTV